MAEPLTEDRPARDPVAQAWATELRRYRADHGLTQTQLAEHLGIHQTTVSQLERGGLVPSTRLQRVLIERLAFDDETLVRLMRGAAS